MRGNRELVVHVRYGSTDEMLNADMAQKVNRPISGQLAINSRKLTVYGSGRRRVQEMVVSARRASGNLQCT